MSKVITLQVQYAPRDSGVRPEEVRYPTIYFWDGEVRTSEGTYYSFPELGPKRIPTGPGPHVLTIGNRRFYLVIQGGLDEEDGPSASDYTLVFIETEDEESPYTVWDPAEHVAKYIAHCESEIEQFQEHADVPVYAQLLQEETLRRDRMKMAWEAGVCTLQPTAELSYFGQPAFIQGEVFPCHEGKLAYPLMTLESGWGDCGNENFFVALDGDGYPCAVYYEASCC